MYARHHPPQINWRLYRNANRPPPYLLAGHALLPTSIIRLREGSDRRGLGSWNHGCPRMGRVESVKILGA